MTVSTLDVMLFIKAFREMAMQYYPDKINVCKDAVSITGMSMTYVLNKSLEKDKTLELFAPGSYLSYMTNVEINVKNCRVVVAMVP